MIRITSGEFRGRQIESPKGSSTRPTQAKLRQAILNTIRIRIQEILEIQGSVQVLDLFSGSGALGFEALSNGATFVQFVELNQAMVAGIRKSVELLKVKDRVRISAEDVHRFLETNSDETRYDFVFADPPYRTNDLEKLLNSPKLHVRLNPGCQVIIEWTGQGPEMEVLKENYAFLFKVREKKYGESLLTTYQWKPNPESGHETTFEVAKDNAEDSQSGIC